MLQVIYQREKIKGRWVYKMILNSVNSQYLGELFCIGDEEGKPLVWAKKINLPDSDEIFVEFNLYFYDVNFNTESMFEKKELNFR